jgi:hypothetical protein
LLLRQNPRENGESRNAHSGSQEQHERKFGNTVPKLFIDCEPQTRPEQKRHGHARLAGHNGGFREAAQRVRSHFQSDQKHEKDQSHLADRI